MRRIRLFIACSLDGYIARRDESIDWLFTDGDYGYSAFISSVDTIVMGRKTYDLLLSFGEYPYPGKTGYVFSRTRTGSDGRVTFLQEGVRPFVERLREHAGRDIWLIGGGVLTAAFLDHDLVDELIISIHPRLLGSGIPLFPAGMREMPLRLVSATSFPTGLVQLTYTRSAP